jgi:pectate lyase
LNVTFHHNFYDSVAERMPRMRFGNAHVFNLYCYNLGAYSPTNNEAQAKGIESTASTATLVENAYFDHAQSGTFPSVDVNGGPTGTIKVVNSIITNSPGANPFIENGAATFIFNAPFVTNQPPYPYAQVLDPVQNVPNIVTNYAGVGKISF